MSNIIHKNSSEQYDYHASLVTHVCQMAIMHHLQCMHVMHVQTYIKRGKGCLKREIDFNELMVFIKLDRGWLGGMFNGSKHFP